jgi:hypothetical protein
MQKVQAKSRPARHVRHGPRYWEIKLRNVAVPAILTAISMMIILIALDYFHFDLAYGVGTTAIIFASFASSAFILFMTPKAKSAKVSRFVKSYVIGGVVGFCGSLMLAYVPLYVTAAAVIFVVSVLLYITDSQHAPAVAIAFAFVIFHIDVLGMLVVMAGALLLILLRFTLERVVFIIEELEEEVSEDTINSHPSAMHRGIRRKHLND